MARALDLHSRGQGFDSLILHGIMNMLQNEKMDKAFTKITEPQKIKQVGCT